MKNTPLKRADTIFARDYAKHVVISKDEYDAMVNAYNDDLIPRTLALVIMESSVPVSLKDGNNDEVAFVLCFCDKDLRELSERSLIRIIVWKEGGQARIRVTEPFSMYIIETGTAIYLKVNGKPYIIDQRHVLTGNEWQVNPEMTDA